MPWNGDQTNASLEDKLEMKKSCNRSFNDLNFQQPSNQRLKEIICAEPYWQKSRHAPRGFTHFSKAYRDYKEHKTALPELLESFKQFDANVNGEVEEVEQVEPPNTSENLERLFQQIQKPEPKLFVEEPQQHNNLTALVIKDLIDLAKKKENQELVLDQLGQLNKKELIRLAAFTQVHNSQGLMSLINLELASHEGGRKSRRKRRRNRKTRRF